KQKNPTVFEIFDDLNLKDDFYIVRYNFGEMISDDKYFYLPSNDSDNFTKVDNKDFPYILNLNKTLELYIETDNFIFPEFIYEPGDFFPMTLNISKHAYLSKPASAFNLTAGLRNIISLPICYQGDNYKKLLKFCGINHDPKPNLLTNHFDLIKKIINKMGIEWQSELLLFPIKLSTKFDKYDKQWDAFIEYKNLISNKTNLYKYNSFYLNHAIDEIMINNSIEITSVALEYLKKIFLIATGDVVGWKPLSDDSSFPFVELTDFMMNFYTENVTPIFMGSGMNKFDNEYIYANIAPISKEIIEKRYYKYLYEICNNIDFFIKGFLKSKLVENTIYQNFSKNLTLNYYTERGKTDFGIKSISQIINDDYRFDQINSLAMRKHETVLSKRNVFLRALTGIKFS
ncbi:MAG: hypothetical protein ACRY3E_06355, partial [Candidatus Lariskella arthropodorum]